MTRRPYKTIICRYRRPTKARDHVCCIMSVALCPSNYVRRIMSVVSCPSDHVGRIISVPNPPLPPLVSIHTETMSPHPPLSAGSHSKHSVLGQEKDKIR